MVLRQDTPEGVSQQEGRLTSGGLLDARVLTLEPTAQLAHAATSSPVMPEIRFTAPMATGTMRSY
jgi:hypothetical protein